MTGNKAEKNSMATNIYIGNFPPTTTAEDLVALFAPYGQVASALVDMDRETGSSRECGFVEMSSEAEALAAITALNNQTIHGRRLCVIRRGGNGTVHGQPALGPEDAPLEGVFTAEEIRELERSGITLESVIREIESTQE